MAGLSRLCKLYGSFTVKSGGKTVTWVWDYVNDRPRLQTEMTKGEWEASEKEKYRRYMEAKNSLK
jgi:hypothetical protein